MNTTLQTKQLIYTEGNSGNALSKAASFENWSYM